MGLFTISTLLNLTTVGSCGKADLEAFAVHDLGACPIIRDAQGRAGPADRFGPGCAHSFMRAREYLPGSELHAGEREGDFAAASEAGAVSYIRRRSCASAWFQAWLCSIKTEAQDLSDITVGKTLYRRV